MSELLSPSEMELLAAAAGLDIDELRDHLRAEVEQRALRIRTAAALSQVAAGELDGDEALALVVCPPAAVRQASMAAARAQLGEDVPST